jgi:hypothetical protein
VDKEDNILMKPTPPDLASLAEKNMQNSALSEILRKQLGFEINKQLVNQIGYVERRRNL